ncbi:MAG: sigma-70 family RNA polymerase sigma factor [Planctomycetes bacterium]|nr:sigma-70 family RNA polymerase sigma factor [Planctomycetota bacterium]
MQRPSPREEYPRHAERPIPLEDFGLVEKVNSGRTEAYGALVKKYQDRVFNACWRICGHAEDAQDLTQEAFLKAFQNLHSFRRESGFYTWIFRIAVNLALSHRRSGATRRARGFGAGEDADHTLETQARELLRRGGSGAGTDPTNEPESVELHAVVARALLQLDGEYRAVVVLRDMEGFDYHEISEILEVPVGTVKSRLHRGRMVLREVLLAAVRGEHGT